MHVLFLEGKADKNNILSRVSFFFYMNVINNDHIFISQKHIFNDKLFLHVMISSKSKELISS